MSRPLFIQATQALSAVLAFDFPADAVLSRHFRDNRELGHRDRGFIAEAVYGVLRRLRWLRRLALLFGRLLRLPALFHVEDDVTSVDLADVVDQQHPDDAIDVDRRGG